MLMMIWIYNLYILNETVQDQEVLLMRITLKLHRRPHITLEIEVTFTYLVISIVQ